jgi:acetate kinase
LEGLGIALDEAANSDPGGGTVTISSPDAEVRVLIVPTDEERMIAYESLRALERFRVTEVLRNQRQQPIPVEVSARHVHLAKEHVEVLFGAGHELRSVGDLSQPGQFAAEETVGLIGPRGRIDRVRVLGPTRPATQVEIAMTDQYRLGIDAPIRESGDLDGTPGLTLEGPAGTVGLEQGVICAQRHLHMPPADALRYGVRDRSVVRVKVVGDRELVFGDVLVRVHPDYALALHIDTDEGNAANVRTGMEGFIVEVQR